MSEDAKTNGENTAYPAQYLNEQRSAVAGFMVFDTYGGLTKREAFAMAAMQGLLAFSHDDNAPTYNNLKSVADSAVVMADFLLTELSKPTT